MNDLLEYFTNNTTTPGEILNWSGIDFDNKVLESTPIMKGRGTPALQEIHIFLNYIGKEGEPIDQTIVDKYFDVVNKYNLYVKDQKEMKNPVLSLKFKNVGYLTVLQSSLYVLSDNKQEIINKTHQLSNLFKTAGLTVLREKVEASVYGIDGIPQTPEEDLKYSGYFEFHIRVQYNDTNPLTKEELHKLDLISELFTMLFKTPVPVSYNNVKEANNNYQRYLNVRFRGIGAIQSVKRVKLITDVLNKCYFKVLKVISEYVWYDTYVQLDMGWIDFEKQEEECVDYDGIQVAKLLNELNLTNDNIQF